jgi:hypothetical protein
VAIAGVIEHSPSRCGNCATGGGSGTGLNDTYIVTRNPSRPCWWDYVISPAVCNYVLLRMTVLKSGSSTAVRVYFSTGGSGPSTLSWSTLIGAYPAPCDFTDLTPPADGGWYCDNTTGPATCTINYVPP